MKYKAVTTGQPGRQPAKSLLGEMHFSRGEGGGGLQGTAVPFLLPLKFEIMSSAIRMRS